MAFTILNCGTAFHRNKNEGEIISDFGRMINGEEYINYLICDGPGSNGGRNAPLPGTFDVYDQKKGKKSDAPAWSKTPGTTLLNFQNSPEIFKASGHGFVTSITGDQTNRAITGDGWDDNIRHAIAVLAKRIFDDGSTDSKTINLIGWSRGAVTCLRMANWFKEFLGPDIKCNIFAIDPVAGLDAGTTLMDTRIVPDNVLRYVGIYAMDERRNDFRPQDQSKLYIQDPHRTQTAYLAFPGVHNTVVTPSNKCPEVAKIVRYMAYQFLSKLGTNFHRPVTGENWHSVLELYAAIFQKRTQYENLGSTVGGWFMGGNDVRMVKTTNAASQKGSYFINPHHRAIFQRRLPDIYTYLFSRNPHKLNNWNSSYQIGLMLSNLPKTKATLQSYFKQTTGHEAMPCAGAYAEQLGGATSLLIDSHLI